jgi:hypothetical protein
MSSSSQEAVRLLRASSARQSKPPRPIAARTFSTLHAYLKARYPLRTFIPALGTNFEVFDLRMMLSTPRRPYFSANSPAVR